MYWHSEALQNVLTELKTDTEKGLSDKEAKKRLQNFGYNRLIKKKTKNIFQKFLEQFSDFMVIILLIAAAISYVTSVFQGEGDIVDPIIILLIVIVNAILGVIQENKADKAIEALQKLSAPVVKLKRNNETISCKSEEVVPGDIIILEAGDYVPADLRIIKSINLKADESSLTGESVPSEKDFKANILKQANVGDRKNMLFSSTVITSGKAEAVACETGMNTEVGKIAHMINTDETPATPLQKRLESTGKILGIAALIICGAIFIMGLIQKVNPLEMFMISVSIAVAAIPESLPAIVTIVLALGVQRMVKNNAIIRKLPAVETLGSATVICSDKTGTLTQNKMTVVKIASAETIYEIGDKFGEKLLSMSALCNNSTVKADKKSFEAQGDPTETALVYAAFKYNKNKSDLEKETPRIGEIPFESERKLMTTLHKLNNGKIRVITKGAPDVLLNICDLYEDKSNIVSLSGVKRTQIMKLNEEMANNALRVLGVAYKDIDVLPSKPESLFIENHLVFLGLAGMIDPPRPEAKKAVAICRRAGIKPVMITGDHSVTAAAIAKELGIMRFEDKVITGTELDGLSQEILNRTINKYSVFARVSPAHKAKIVKAYQANGHVVAMTGDGVNDAPALKIADIGCAMGVSGTDVAKGAADMILTDDNFASIVEAVHEGRGLYQNIRKAIHFLLSCNVGEIMTIFVAFFMGMPSPLLPIQLLWVNLVTDSLPALALGVDTIDEDIMTKKPVSPKKSLFADGMGSDIIFEGLMIGGLALMAYILGKNLFDIEGVAYGRTMAFAVLSLSQLVHAFNARSEHSLFHIGVFSNMSLIKAFIICAIMQISVITIAPIAKIFKVMPLNLTQWIIVAVLSFMPFVFVEVSKWLGKKKNNNLILDTTLNKG